MPASFANPERAPVRPRVTLAGGSVARLLEEEVAELLAKGTGTAVQLVGPPGSGRTTALVHLAATFAGDARLGLCDVDGGGIDGEQVRVTASHRSDDAGTIFTLAPWSDDDVLEYLVHAHKERAAATFAWWQRAQPDLGRWPGLCRAVLDHFAMQRAFDLTQALRLVFDEQLAGERRHRARQFALEHSTADDVAATQSPDASMPCLGAPAVRALLAAERMLQLVLREQAIPLASVYWSPALLDAVRAEVTGDEAREARLLKLSRWTAALQFASCISLLCAAHAGFRPSTKELGDLQHAYLAGADLRQLRLQQLDSANLTAADLRGANLRGASCKHARLRRARMNGVMAEELQAEGLDGSYLQAPSAQLLRANLRDADLSHAVLDGANLHQAVLARSSLDDTSLRGAILGEAHLMHSSLDGSDLRDALCTGATLVGLDLRTALLDGVHFDFANLDSVDLSGTVIQGLHARQARFHNAMLTGARWPGAQLHSASFAEAGLAGVDWEGADLRASNFRGAAFHFGGSRSGLVGSNIPSEGSRTGYYTDESLEDRFQAPEDVRKANLRFCDLRGAKVFCCDFYLVDLRGARLDPEQLQWLRRCRAILDREAGAT